MSDELQAGRELDAMVAKAIGVEPTRIAIATRDGGEGAAVVENGRDGPFYTKSDVERWVAEHSQYGYVLGEWLRYPQYSTDIAAAWQVVEKLSETYRVCVHRRANGDIGEGHNLYEIVIWLDFWNCDPEKPLAVIRAMTAPLGICRAAIKVSATRHGP